MAIARDTSKMFSSGASSSLTTSYTCSGTNRLLMVYAFRENSETVTGITYNGTAMTLATSKAQGTSTAYAYYLINPATGANNIVVSFSGASSNCIAGAISYTGVKQSAQPDAINSSSSASATSLTTSVTTVADNAWISGFFICLSGGSGNFSANNSFGYILQGTNSPATGVGWDGSAVLDTNTAIATAGATTVGAQTTGTANLAVLLGVSIAPVSTIAYNITASAGSFVLTGITTAFTKALKMAGVLGTFILTSIDNILTLGHVMLAETVSFTLTGIDTLFGVTLSMLVSVGEFTLTGIDAVVKSARIITSDVASFILTGVDATLKSARTIATSVGEFTLTGVASLFSIGRYMIAGTGEFILTGIAIRFPILWKNTVKNVIDNIANTTKNLENWVNTGKTNNIE